MPGVIMENGDRNRSHTNHERDSALHTSNGLSRGLDGKYDDAKGKGRNHESSNGNALHKTADASLSKDMAAQLTQLPPELRHITEGLISLPTLLARRAQVSHNNMNQMIQTLASMPIPPPAVNGNYTGSVGDEAALDNLRKKVQLLKWAEKEHADWVKALVITSWSRVSDDVGKLIDLKVHADEQKLHYDWAVDNLVEMKRSLIHARVPNPDLKTALEILSTGKAPWMPELGYIDTPPLTGKELKKSLKDLNTLLSIRLNLHDYDSIPFHFKTFSIKSGRVTFKVKGEFELDLTIADEDSAAQFWFIDFRFTFSPSSSETHETLRNVVEGKVNAVLEKDGLAGAYKYLHELTLTHKLSTVRRQAADMGRGTWIDSLKVEGLHRALSIQYWADRFGPGNPPLDWIILGVHSGRSKDGKSNPKATSYVKMRWWRNKKEIENFNVPIDMNNICAEDVVLEIIKQHTSTVLDSIYQVLKKKLLFENNQLALTFSAEGGDLKDMHLSVQLTQQDTIRIEIEPISGRFAISGGSRQVAWTEAKLNSLIPDASSTQERPKLRIRTPEEIASEIETLRCAVISERLVSRAISVGWKIAKNPGLDEQDLKPILPKDTLRVSWLRRQGWKQDWLVAFTASMSGERFWLLQTTAATVTIPPPAKASAARKAPERPISSVKLVSNIQIPVAGTTPPITHAWFNTLHLAASAMISIHVNLQALHRSKIPYHAVKRVSNGPLVSVTLPLLFVTLSKLSKFVGPPWARDILKISFHGIEESRASSATSYKIETPSAEGSGPGIPKVEPAFENGILIAQALMTSPMPVGLDVFKHQVDKDISFHPTSGAFAVRLHHRIGESAIPQLQEKISRVEQLVQFVRTAKRHSKTLHLENISLRKVDLSYDKFNGSHDDEVAPSTKHRATIDFSHEKDDMIISFDVGNPHIRLLDMFTKILNDLGLDGVATYLPLTLPMLRACEAIEDAWTTVDNGEVILLSRAVDWHIIRYTMTIESPTPTEHRVDIEARIHSRKGEPWWLIRRGHSQQPDYIDKALLKVWDTNSDGEAEWRGMHTSAIAQNSGVEEVLKKIDQVMREVAASPAPPAEAVVEVKVPDTDAQQSASKLQAPQVQAPVQPAQPQQSLSQSRPQVQHQSQIQNSQTGNRPQPTPQQIQQMQQQRMQAMANMTPQMRQAFAQQMQARQAQAQQQRKKNEAIVID